MNTSQSINPPITHCNVSELRCHPSVPALGSQPPIDAHRQRSPGWPPEIPNGVSHPPFHPYASGHHGPFQGPAGASPSSGPWCSGPWSGTSSVTSADSVGIFQSMALTDKNTSVDMHTSRAGKGVRPLGKPMDQPIDLTRIQRECLYSETGIVSYPQPKTSTSTSLGHIYPGVESVSCSSDYERPIADEPSKSYSPPASSYYSKDVNDRVMAPSERHMQSLPGVAHCECPFSALTESGQHEHTSESDSDILLHFGLAEEDLDHLASYPEDEVTPANLPSILRRIRSEKTKRSTTAAQLRPSPDALPSVGVPGMDSHGVSPSGQTHQEDISPAVLEPGEALGCGRTDRCARGAGGETGSVSPMDNSAGHIGEPPSESRIEVRISALAVSRDQTSSESSLGKFLHSETKLQTQPNRGSQATLGSFSLPKTDADKSEASKPDPSKDPEADRRSTAKTQPPSSTRHCGESPRGPDLVVVGSNGTSGNVDQGGSKDPTVVVEPQQNEERQPVRPDTSPSVFSATTTVSRILIVNGALRPLPFIPVGPPPVGAWSPTIPEPKDLVLPPPPPPSIEQPLAKASWVSTAAIWSFTS
ncbi:Zinc finger protein 638 [Liparis tanakae]|uniref:Zinc finger protein 638 n=1 Tax=Liparis tanakae TaxID=230148 RepID=A0A4Z2GIS5_9TELE|nr:Zinc finger protein 638 [Liparis tanakae]